MTECWHTIIVSNIFINGSISIISWSFIKQGNWTSEMSSSSWAGAVLSSFNCGWGNCRQEDWRWLARASASASPREFFSSSAQLFFLFGLSPSYFFFRPNFFPSSALHLVRKQSGPCSCTLVAMICQQMHHHPPPKLHRRHILKFFSEDMVLNEWRP